MRSTAATATAAAALFFFVAPLVFLTIFLRSTRRKQVRLPPGPRQWPFVGNLLQIGPRPHRSMMELNRRYGPVVYLRLGCAPTLVVDSPVIAKEMLTRNDHVFASRPEASIACSYFTYGGSDIAFAPYGVHWREMRKLAKVELLSPRHLAAFRSGRTSELQHLMASVYADAAAGRATSLREGFATLSCCTLTRMLLGKRHFGPEGAGPADGAEQRRMIYQGFGLVNAFNVSDYIPLLRWLDIHGHEREIKSIMDRVDEVYGRIVQEHKLKKKRTQLLNADGKADSPSPRDFVDVLLDAPGINGEAHLPDNTVKAIVIDLLSAGTDTSAVSSEWAMAELVRHPHELQKVRDEIDAVVGSCRQVEEADLPKLRRLRAAVKEAFRLHPVGAFLIPHFSTQDSKVSGYDVPKGTRILVNNYSLGRCRESWGEDAEEFRPGRFLGGGGGGDEAAMIEMGDVDCRMLPFGAGRRSCPGAALGTTIVMMGVARLVHAFDWAPPGGIKAEEIDMEEKLGFTVLRSPLVMVASPRLQIALYDAPLED